MLCLNFEYCNNWQLLYFCFLNLPTVVRPRESRFITNLVWVDAAAYTMNSEQHRSRAIVCCTAATCDMWLLEFKLKCCRNYFPSHSIHSVILPWFMLSRWTDDKTAQGIWYLTVDVYGYIFLSYSRNDFYCMCDVTRIQDENSACLFYSSNFKNYHQFLVLSLQEYKW